MKHMGCKPTNSTQPSELMEENGMLRCPACGHREQLYPQPKVTEEFSNKTSHKKKKKRSR